MSKFKIIIIAAFSVLAFYSCEKEANVIDTDESLIESSIIELTKEFIKNEKPIKGTGHWLESSSRLPKWLEVALSDAIGATVGTLLGGPVGGVVYGVGCSLAAGLGIAPPPNGGGVGNSDNAFDYVGEYHVDILHDCLTQQSNFIFPNGQFNFDNYVQIADQFLISNGTISGPSGFTTAGFNNIQTTVNTAIANANGVLSVVYANMGTEGLLTSVESGILASYFNAFENSSSFQSFLQYSVMIEATITQSNLSASSKERILITMSTARHDLNYWKNL